MKLSLLLLIMHMHYLTFNWIYAIILIAGDGCILFYEVSTIIEVKN